MRVVGELTLGGPLLLLVPCRLDFDSQSLLSLLVEDTINIEAPLLQMHERGDQDADTPSAESWFQTGQLTNGGGAHHLPLMS